MSIDQLFSQHQKQVLLVVVVVVSLMRHYIPQRLVVEVLVLPMVQNRWQEAKLFVVCWFECS
jgi:hypothetical protein